MAPLSYEKWVTEHSFQLICRVWRSAMAHLTVDLELERVRTIVRDFDSTLDPVGFALEEFDLSFVAHVTQRTHFLIGIRLRSCTCTPGRIALVMELKASNAVACRSR